MDRIESFLRSRYSPLRHLIFYIIFVLLSISIEGITGLYIFLIFHITTQSFHKSQSSQTWSEFSKPKHQLEPTQNWRKCQYKAISALSVMNGLCYKSNNPITCWWCCSSYCIMRSQYMCLCQNLGSTYEGAATCCSESSNKLELHVIY